MAPNATPSPSTHVLPHLVFDDLEKGFSNKEIAFRIIHFWEVRHPKKGGLLIGLELLLIDQKSTVIHAFITANRIGCYERKLKSGEVYKIKNFLVINNKTSYRVSSHKFLIQFTQLTKLDEVVDYDHLIERQKFRIRSFAEFEEAVNMNQDLYDTVGKIILINNENFNNGKPDDIGSGFIKGKIEVHLQLRNGPVVRLTLWDNVALSFQKKLMKSIDKPVVLLATTVNPITVRDMFCLSSTSSTRIFFDNDVDPSTDYLTWLHKEGNNSGTLNSFTSEVTKSEPVTIDELFQFLKTDTPQDAKFSCIATIVEILPQYGWNYIACTKCASKLKEGGTALVCNKCQNNNAIGEIRYRVELSVYDKGNIATFVVFDRDAAKLTGIRATDVLETMQANEIGAIDNQNSIPQCLLDHEGRTYKFQLKITPYNFNATRQTFTVTHILEEQPGEDETPEEITNGPNPPDGPNPPNNNGAKTSITIHSNSVEVAGHTNNNKSSDDSNTDVIKHKDKRRRRN